MFWWRNHSSFTLVAVQGQSREGAIRVLTLPYSVTILTCPLSSISMIWPKSILGWKGLILSTLFIFIATMSEILNFGCFCSCFLFVCWIISSLLGCQYGKPSRDLRFICLFYYWVASMANPVGICVSFFRFFRVGKSLACHSPAKWCLCA